MTNPFASLSPRKVPPGALGLAWGLWSLQTELWWVGVPLAVLCEWPHWTTFRRTWAEREWERIWDLCAALFFCFIVYLLISRDNGIGILELSGDRGSAMRAGIRGGRAWLRLLQGLPVVVAPMLLAQVWSSATAVPYRAFSWYLRKYPAWFDDSRLGLRLNFAWIGLGLVVLGSSLGPPSRALFAGLVLLLGYLLLFQADLKRRGSWMPTMGALACCVCLAWATQRVLHPISAWWQRWEAELIAKWMGNRFEGQESRTWMGEIGSRKTSGRIVMQLDAKPGEAIPSLLREGTFDNLQGRTWVQAGRAGYESLGSLPLPMNPDGTPEESAIDDGSDEVWLLSEAAGSNSFRVWLRDTRDGLHIPVPAGTRRLTSLSAIRVDTNHLGSIRVGGWQSPRFEIAYDPKVLTVHGGPPSRIDHYIPEIESAGITSAALEAGISTNLPPEANLERIGRFFLGNFSYSMWQPGARPRGTDETALSRFLGTTRRGHCEYFASAGTLLLRKAGIPARYAVGWSIDPPSNGRVEIRARHAHAWSLAWINGGWREVDFTPGTSSNAEEEAIPWWEPVTDVIGRASFAFQRFRYQQTSWRQWLLLPAGLLVLGAAFPLIRQKTSAPQLASGVIGAGLDSPFFAVLERWKQWDENPNPSETPRAWWRRLHKTGRVTGDQESVEPMIQIHERIRFDPSDVSSEERANLARAVKKWLADNPVRKA